MAHTSQALGLLARVAVRVAVRVIPDFELRGPAMKMGGAFGIPPLS